MFYFPSSAADGRKISTVMNSISYGPMTVLNLQANIRNSYEVSTFLGILREEFKDNLPGTWNNFTSQRFSHFVHGPRPKVHYIRSSKRGNLADKMNEIIASDLKQLDLPSQENPKGNRMKLTNSDFKILHFTGSKKKSKRAESHELDFPNLKEYTTKIRYSYSREWAVVFVLLNINKDTIYQEFLSRLYLGASRARVHCSVIIYLKGGDPPGFIDEFLRRVEDDSMALKREYSVKDTSLKAQIEVASYHLNKKMRLE